ncbi:MAG: T9SS type B sorting domain-containing protein [Bacteroidota bacterium]
MRKQLLLFIVCFNMFCVFSQQQTNIWYFGNNAGLDFTNGPPVALNDGQLVTEEGCAAISDLNGDLLFYTDGSTVWDRNHNVMPNGTGLQGSSTSTQSGIIVPFPNDPTRYYLFSVDNNTTDGGLFYSVVDLSLNGGNGDIVPVLKNIELLFKSAEKIAAIADGLGGYWVIGYSSPFANNGSNYNTFHAFRIAPNGTLNTNAVKSTYNSCRTNDGRGYLKISPDGSKIIVCNQNRNFACLHDFDLNTGTVSPAIAILDTGNPVYGAEFSPNSEKVYVSSGEYVITDASLHQFDITAPDIPASRVELRAAVERRAGLQLGIDRKIYYARPGQNYVGVINDPNADGLACGFVNNAVSLGTATGEQGFPPFIQSLFTLAIEGNLACTEASFSINTDQILSIAWDFGDGTTSILENPTHAYAAAGTYEVAVTATVVVNSLTFTQTYSRIFTISEPPIANEISDITRCAENVNDGTATFDLSTRDAEVLAGQDPSNTYSVAYFISLNNAEQNLNPLPTNYTSTSNPEQVFARISIDTSPSCYAISDFNLIVAETPQANSMVVPFICDNLNDGQEIINLSQFDTELLGTQNDGTFDVYYYETFANATNDTDRLPVDYLLQNTTQTIFARKENSEAPECFVVTDFELEMNAQFVANTVGNLITCDDISNDGIEVFNLAEQNDLLLDGQVGNFSINYFISQEDADMNTNPIPEAYINITNPQEIFVRVQNNDSETCYDTTSFFIEVKETPNIDLGTITRYVCTNESIELSVPSGFDEYLWSTGATTTSITVTEAVTYTVTVTNNYASSPAISCASVQTIQVIESDEAIIETIEIQDWTSNNNQIEVLVLGIGDYEFSVDGFTYQDSPIFDNLSPGDLTVYVRDKNGCGILSDDINLLFYPNFFTPNNDGFNDHWQIISSRAEPDLRIYIFDRYGKLLKILSPESEGWDGLYRGRPMPSSDYWFRVERPSNGRTYTGNFTLKR